MALPYEEVFLKLALKNKLLSPEQASALLTKFRALKDDSKSIDAVAQAEGLLSADQCAALKTGTARVIQGSTTAAQPAVKPPTQSLKKPATVRAPAPKPNPAEPIPGYKILKKLGVGGTAIVFLAEDAKNGGREVALKMLLPARAVDAKMVDRFEREAKLLINFDHPNIVKGYDYGCVEAPNMPRMYYCAMEFLPGESIQSLIERVGPLKEQQAIEIILECAKALEYIQGQGIIHRDIKPDNIAVSADGGIKLLDLGFAIPMATSEMPVSDEEEGTTSGTVQYMSPEQAQGQHDLDVRSDIYSLGATLFHMVMGEVPFSGTDSLEVMAKQVLESLNSSELKNRRISRHMHYFIERMMSKDKNFRYSNAAEMVTDIQEQLEGFKSLEFDASQAESDLMSSMKKPEKPRTQRISRRFKRP